MNDEVEVQPVSVMKRNGKKYNKLLKSQAIKAHLNGAKFADVSKQFGPPDFDSCGSAKLHNF